MGYGSTIKRKKCKCGNCKCYPTLQYNGWNFKCAPAEIKERVGGRKKAAIKTKNARKAAALKLKKIKREDTPEGNIKENWFSERRKEMTGVCLFCGGKTEWDNDKTFRNSIAHLLEKKDNFGGFPSVAYHPDNWLELCYYNNSCHDNFDRHMITWDMLRDSAEWEFIVSKFKKIEPFIAIAERRNIPELLLKSL